MIENVRLYGEMHRFIPGLRCLVRRADRPRCRSATARACAGKSKYGISRTIKVVLDLLALKFLNDFSTKPIQLFGGLGMLCLLAGGGAMLLTLYQLLFEGVKANRNPLLLPWRVLPDLGPDLSDEGLLAEMITRTYHESQHKPTYAIRRRIRRRPGGAIERLNRRLGRPPNQAHHPWPGDDQDRVGTGPPRLPAAALERGGIDIEAGRELEGGAYRPRVSRRYSPRSGYAARRPGAEASSNGMLGSKPRTVWARRISALV